LTGKSPVSGRERTRFLIGRALAGAADREENGMKDDKSNSKAGIGRRSFLKAAGATLAAPAFASLPASVARADDVVNLTFWAWTPGTDDAVAMFEKQFPNIKINHQNVGQGAPHYQKLRDAIKAGTGLPDVAQMEFNSIPSFKILNALADMGSAGANDFKDVFVDWTWKSASDGDKVYGIPWDSGPMGLLYREDVFSENGLAVPKTWAEFSDESLKLAKDKPGKFLTHFGASDGGWVAAVLWQKGWRPFKVDGTNIQIALNDKIAKDWAAYWQKLIDAKAASVVPLWSQGFFADFDNGTTASWVTAAWGPTLIAGAMKNSVGKWRAAYMPQWKAGDNVVSNWGGSTFAAMSSTKHLKEATQFATYMGGNKDAGIFWNTKEFLFPTQKALIADETLMGHKYDFYGGQAVNEVFAKAEDHVDPSFQFAPFQDYVNSQLQDQFAAALAGKQTLAEAFDKVQDTIVGYAKDQGFTVS
jgi:multiple sugar transport system substrate-binding protein